MSHIRNSTNSPLQRARQRGSALLELSLSIPLLGLLLVGAMDFARVFYTQITVASAARAGAQYGMQSLAKSIDSTGIQQAVTDDSSDVPGVTAVGNKVCLCNSNGIQTTGVCGSTCPSGNVAYVYVQVAAQKTFTTLISYPLVPSSAVVKQTVMMRVIQ